MKVGSRGQETGATGARTQMCQKDSPFGTFSFAKAGPCPVPKDPLSQQSSGCYRSPAAYGLSHFGALSEHCFLQSVQMPDALDGLVLLAELGPLEGLALLAEVPLPAVPEPLPSFAGALALALPADGAADELPDGADAELPDGAPEDDALAELLEPFPCDLPDLPEGAGASVEGADVSAVGAGASETFPNDSLPALAPDALAVSTTALSPAAPAVA